ncbi:tripartite motif-containing protein 6 isoform X2 [Phacochoerus africanus]|uniref:tripartite motif-containing protein 6 isoform X2 n=1 Tax=Phacochoerus africanus TaxID=41426 RepID=UPI001FD9FDBB|nr:tripartite motif-containing protein 6 isoform X2 [Phacochoerus africanus]
MTSAVLVDIQEEVTCPICLELLTDPLSIDCGHSFCQACITQNSEEWRMGQGGESSCPVCQTRYRPGNLRPNRHLANIAERLREVVLGSGTQLKVILCAHHGEKLQLFCREDGQLICWLCERAQEHRGHHTFLMEEVAQEYQERFQESLKKLRQEQQEAEKLAALIREKRASWKNQMEPERHRIQKQFDQLRSILDKEEQRQLRKLEEEERKGLSVIAEAEGELVQQSQCLRELISDLERRCQGSMMELLQDVRDVAERSEFWTLKKPEALPTKLKSVFRAPDLKKMLRVFRELTDVQSYWVDVTLNPHTANLNLVLSKNRRQPVCHRSERLLQIPTSERILGDWITPEARIQSLRGLVCLAAALHDRASPPCGRVPRLRGRHGLLLQCHQPWLPHLHLLQILLPLHSLSVF